MDAWIDSSPLCLRVKMLLQSNLLLVRNYYSCIRKLHNTLRMKYLILASLVCLIKLLLIELQDLQGQMNGK